MNIDDYADETGLELLRLEPRSQFDPCIVGIVERFNQTFVVYDKDMVLAALQADGLDEEDALEHFSFNIAGAWVGDGTPGFLSRLGHRIPEDCGPQCHPQLHGSMVHPGEHCTGACIP